MSYSEARSQGICNSINTEKRTRQAGSRAGCQVQDCLRTLTFEFTLRHRKKAKRWERERGGTSWFCFFTKKLLKKEQAESCGLTGCPAECWDISPRRMSKHVKCAFLLWTKHLKLPILPTACQLPTYLKRKEPFKPSHPPRVAGTPHTLSGSSQSLIREKERGKSKGNILAASRP